MRKINNKGFGLIETLVSILLLSIVLVAGLSFYFNGDELMSLAVHRKMATEIANSRIEDLKRAGYSNLPAAGVTVVANILVGDLSATQTTTVADIDDPVGGTNPDYKEVLVGAAWTEVGKISSPQQIELKTFIAP